MSFCAHKHAERQVFPGTISYQSSNFDHTVTDSCTPYPSNTSAPQGINPTEYVRCNHPTTITDDNTGPPFYIWGEAPGHLLLEFPTPTNFSSIMIYYQYNATYALAKLRIYAVPDSFSVWDLPDNSYESRGFDEVRPGVGVDGLRELPDPAVPPIQFVTSKVLIDKLEDTKTFLFAFSEVAFQEYYQQGEFIVHLQTQLLISLLNLLVSLRWSKPSAQSCVRTFCLRTIYHSSKVITLLFCLSQKNTHYSIVC